MISFETGLNFELLRKNAPVSKRHFGEYFYLELLAGKEIMPYDPKWWALPFSSHLLLFIVTMISYRDDADKVWSDKATQLL